MGKGLVALTVSDVWIQSGICRSVSVERSQKIDALKHHPRQVKSERERRR